MATQLEGQKEPLKPVDLDRELGCWTPSGPFAQLQGRQLRVINDLFASHINSAFAWEEAADNDGLGRIAGNVKAHMDAISVTRRSLACSVTWIMWSRVECAFFGPGSGLPPART